MKHVVQQEVTILGTSIHEPEIFSFLWLYALRVIDKHIFMTGA